MSTSLGEKYSSTIDCVVNQILDNTLNWQDIESECDCCVLSYTFSQTKCKYLLSVEKGNNTLSCNAKTTDMETMSTASYTTIDSTVTCKSNF